MGSIMSQGSASTEFTIEPVSSQFSVLLSAASTVEVVGMVAIERRVACLERLLVRITRQLDINNPPPAE